MTHSFLCTIILTLGFFYGIKTVEIQRKIGDIFPGERSNNCTAAGGFIESQGLCKCPFSKHYFVSEEGKAPICRGTTEIKDDLKCTLASYYIEKNGQSTNFSQDFTGEWYCGTDYVEAQYWDYNDVTHTGSWKTSALLTDLTVKQQKNRILKIKFDNRNWNGMIIKLIQKDAWCTTCRIIKFEGILDYPIKQANFLPKLLTTTSTITTTTATVDSTNIPSTPTTIPSITSTPVTSTTTTPTTTTSTTTSTTTTTPTSTPTILKTTTKTSIPTTTIATQQKTTPRTTQTVNNISETSKDSDTLMIGVAVGVAATITLIVIFLAFCVIYRLKKKKQQNNQGTVATIQVANPWSSPSYATINSKHNPYSAISPYKGRSEIYMGLNQMTVEIYSTAPNFDSTVMIDETKNKDNIPHYEVDVPHYEVNVPHYEVDIPHYEVDKTYYEVGDIGDYEDCDTNSEINVPHELNSDD